MQFDNLRLTTTSINPLVQFYESDLGCSLVEHTQGSVTFDAGSTRLTFDANPDANSALYHVAFTVDTGIHAVESQLTDRVEILSVDEELSVTSEFIEADMVYFLDPVGNILEFVCPFGAAGDFDPSAVRCVCM